MGCVELVILSWHKQISMSNVFIMSQAGWPAYDTFHIESLSSWPVYYPNLLKFNPNPQKLMLCLRVRSKIDTPSSNS